MKKISVIIPCYNVEQWIDRCITSIVRQTLSMEDVEIICVDDASTDDTWSHLQYRLPNGSLLWMRMIG